MIKTLDRLEVLGHSRAMNELPPLLGIPAEDWEAIPLSVRVLLVSLLQEIRKLKTKLNQTSQNSSKPPSFDGSSTPPRLAKTPHDRCAGGQAGHDGQWRDNPLPEHVTETVNISPSHCPNCQMPLAAMVYKQGNSLGESFLQDGTTGFANGR
jgi:transposase